MSAYDFPARLHQARRRRGWTQTELGKRAQVHAMVISRLERGIKRDVNGATLRKLAAALGVTADWLLGLTDTATTEEEEWENEERLVRIRCG